MIFLAGCIFRKDSLSLTFSYYNNQGLTPDLYVESGLPVVAVLTGHRHAITIIGHLSDFNISFPGTPESSDVYLCGFIANDDNFLPYHGVRKNDPVPDGYWSRFKVEDIDDSVDLLHPIFNPPNIT